MNEFAAESGGYRETSNSNARLQSPIAMRFPFCLAGFLFCCGLTLAQNPGTEPNQWVRQAMENELNAEQHDTSHWIFRLRTEQPNGRAEVDEVAETAQGDLKRPLVVDGRKLTASESEKRMQQLSHDEHALQKSLKDKNEDTAKSQQLLKMLADAFMFKYAERRGAIICFAFSPNPKFKPANHEAEVFHAMNGNIWFNSKQSRLQELSGRLSQEVKFGGGLLGHLDPGCDFDFKQAEVAPGFWELTVLNVDMKGKTLFFKTINVQQKLLRNGFKKVPDDLSLQMAAQMLKQRNSTR